MSSRLHLLLAAASLASPAFAQGVWVPVIPGSPAGESATLTVLPGSNAQFVTLQLRTPGFWRETVTGSDGLTYDRLTFPGLDRLGLIGSPELPALRPRCAAASDASAWTLATAPSATHVFFTGYNVYPTPLDARDEAIDPTVDPGLGDPNGADELFQKDSVVYAQPGFFPGVLAPATSDLSLNLGSIPAGAIELTPVNFDPTSGRLRVSSLLTASYEALASGPLFFPGITADRARRAAATFANWGALGGAIPTDPAFYRARYLIVTPEEYLATLEPFILHRKRGGYPVTTITLESLASSTCADIEAAIDAWYAMGATEEDHFALLVGDQDVLPTCLSPGGVCTDDPYGDVLGNELDEEVLVGRWSVDGKPDLAARIDTLIAYELDEDSDHDYRRVTAVAHIDGAPDQYEANLLKVSTATYGTALVFDTNLGSAGATNSVVQDSIEKFRGVVAYRGHGTTNSWPAWNGVEDFHKNEVIGLEPPMTPIVWSVACNHNALGGDDSLGETWLEEGHAVAHYGASAEGGRRKNDRLLAALFEGAFEQLLGPHGHVLAWAEDQLEYAFGKDPYENEWMYSLLGCPATRVRRAKAGAPFQLVVPTTVNTQSTGNGFTILVQDSVTGQPVPGVIVSVYKEAFDGSGDELLFAAVTGTGGTANIPTGPNTLGSINTQGSDDDGNVVVGEEIAVQAGAFTDIGGGNATPSYVPRLVSDSSLLPMTVATFDISDARSDAPGIMLGSTVDPNLPLMEYDAILHVDLSPMNLVYQRAFVTDSAGNASVVEQGVPDLSGSSGQSLFFQAVYVDDQAPGGLGATNGLEAVIP
jgi:hypothetical protein